MTTNTTRPAVAGGGELLRVADLTLDIATPQGVAHVLRGVDLSVQRGTTLGIVGESGSGKSMLLRTVLGLLPSRATVGGRVVLDGVELGSLRPRERAEFVGRRVGIVFQNPMTSLNPVLPIAKQMSEASRYHLGLTKQQARRLSLDLLKQVGIPNAEKRLDDYPHQFSGGMRQRVMIAMALTTEPELLVADEATTALDVTIAKGILDLLEEIQRERQMTMIIVSHDLSIVAGRTDDVIVMYGGRIVDRRRTDQMFTGELHPYTSALVNSIPRLDMKPHTRLAALIGQPPSVFEPTLDEEAANRRDLERWETARVPETTANLKGQR